MKLSQQIELTTNLWQTLLRRVQGHGPMRKQAATQQVRHLARDSFSRDCTRQQQESIRNGTREGEVAVRGGCLPLISVCT